MKAPLLTLLACLYANLAFATTQPPLEPDATTSTEATVSSDSPSDPQTTIRMSDEEKSYIDAECKRFATDDEVATDKLADYLALCNYELTIAVQAALLKRHEKKKRQAEIINTNKPATNQPKPM